MSADHPLDRPVWNALTTRQAALAIRKGGVLRFDSAYATFAAAGPDATAGDWLALVRATGRLALFQADVVVPEGLVEIDRIDCLQMTATEIRAGGGRSSFRP